MERVLDEHPDDPHPWDDRPELWSSNGVVWEAFIYTSAFSGGMGGASYEGLRGFLDLHSCRIDASTREEILTWVPLMIAESARLHRERSEEAMERRRSAAPSRSRSGR